MRWLRAAWTRLRRARLAILGAIFSLGLALSAVSPAFAAGTYTVWWQTNNWNWPGPPSVSLMQGNGYWGWSHVVAEHAQDVLAPISPTDMSNLSGLLKTESWWADQCNLVWTNDYGWTWALGSDWSPATNSSEIVTVFELVGQKNGQWTIITAYPMQEGAYRDGIASDTNVGLDVNNTKTQFPWWMTTDNMWGVGVSPGGTQID